LLGWTLGASTAATARRTLVAGSFATICPSCQSSTAGSVDASVTTVVDPATGVMVKRSDASGPGLPKPRPVIDTSMSLLPTWMVAIAGLFGRFAVARARLASGGASSSKTPRVHDGADRRVMAHLPVTVAVRI
jgi:hypothetical protein